MEAIARRIIGVVGALTLAVTGTTLLAAPAVASQAPWTWKRVTQGLSLGAHGYASVRTFCPSGFTAITGGLDVGRYSGVYANAEYRLDDASGSSWFVSIENSFDTNQFANFVAECVESADLPPISHDFFDFPSDGGRVRGRRGLLSQPRRSGADRRR